MISKRLLKTAKYKITFVESNVLGKSHLSFNPIIVTFSHEFEFKYGSE